MDKVIKDGVDVSGCEHYRAEIETKMPYGEYEIQKDKCHYSGIEIIQDCKGNKGCIYKQLKRLQAEYDDLHLSYAGCKTANTGLQELNQKLQQENEWLREENEKLNNQYCFSTILKINELEQENERLKEENKQLKKLKFKSDGIELLQDANLNLHNANVKYRQALQEIKDIAEKEIVCDNCNFEGTDKCDARMCTHFYLNDFSKDILDKINEVIGAE